MDKRELQCIETALRFLSIREHNRKELVFKLKTKGYEALLINKAVAFLMESGDLDEKRYVRSFVLSSNRKHPEGKKLILCRLESKGADKEVAKEVVDSIYTEQYTENLRVEAETRFKKKLSKKFSGSEVGIENKQNEKYRETEKFELSLKQMLFKAGFSLSKTNGLD